MKFGGSLLDSETKLKNIVNIVKTYYSSNNEIVIIISALDGVTDRILDVCNHIKEHDKNSLLFFLNEIEKIHSKLAEKLTIDPNEKLELLKLITNLINEFKDILIVKFC